MSFNLVESVKSVFSVDVTNRISGILGESSANIQLAMQAVVPAVLTGILLKAESGDAQDTLNLSTDAARIDIPANLNSLSGGTGSSKGLDFLKGLFGEKTSILSNSISSFSGVNSQSAISLLSIAAPAALGALGNHILDSNMNASGLRSFLNSQRKKILNQLPAGILLEGIMGFENLSDLAGKFSGSENIEASKKSGLRWVLPVLLALAVAVAIWYFVNKPAAAIINPVSVLDTTAIKKDTVISGPEENTGFSVKLPDGAVLNVRRGGIEEQLVNFLNDPNGRPSRRFPFSFDQLVFNTGSAVISNESMVQVQNIAFILKAYPKVKIKIGGFNDKGGDSVQNKTLSESRASSLASALKASGVNPAQITGVEGFGSDFAKYSADAPDSSREKDRRISISVRAK